MTLSTKFSNNLLNIEWPAENVLAFSTTRHPPEFKTSEYCTKTLTGYDAFNVGEHVGDCARKVADNRKQLLSLLPATTKIQWLEQVHGNNVVDIITHSAKPIVADAAITRQKNIALAIMTADCLPILLTNKTGSEIAAIHAGWRPLSANIIANTLSKMQTNNADVFVWLGPCIGKHHFEVGTEVKQIFCNLLPELSIYFSKNSSEKFQADLVGIAQHLLTVEGVKSIESFQECTFADKYKYYSYRRESKTGRMASIISLKT